MSLDNELKSIAQAYLSMLDEKKMAKEDEHEGDDDKVECPKCEGKGCDHCDDKGYHMKKDEAMDPVNKKAVKKDFGDRKDKDIDNDGDVDDSDEYLHKRRKAISKSVKKESYDWDTILEMSDDELDAFIDSLPESAIDQLTKEFEAISEAASAQMKPKPEDQEKLEPRAAGEKDFADKHKVDVKDNPETKKQDGSEKVKQAAGRKGDKRLKDVRK